MIANLIKIVLGIFSGALGGSMTNVPQIPGPMMKVLDKFAVLIAAVCVIYYMFGHPFKVELNGMELGFIVLLFNLAFKSDPPDRPNTPGAA